MFYSLLDPATAILLYYTLIGIKVKIFTSFFDKKFEKTREKIGDIYVHFAK